MDQWLSDYQLWCRAALFFIALGILARWETKAPWRLWLTPRKLRFARHLSLALISKILVRLLFPLFTLGAAFLAQQKDLGLLNQVKIPTISKIAIGIIAMDFVVYLQHIIMHRYRFLWRFHRVHHIDTQVDVTTGLRFHPFEEILNMAAKSLGVIFIGVPVLGAFLFELLLNMASLYTHVNVSIKAKSEKILRRIIVTPVMHRIHHSDYYPETNSNYGFCFSWWDKLFGTYCYSSMMGERKLIIGLEEYRDPKYQTLENMLLLPFNVKSLKLPPKKIMKTKMKLYN